ncbi:hypothetical protein [Gemella cuniculi]|uniref:hypothetical protein n=1 Tax=Gemella cuniculi TaxID=150240 RepID=UPI0004894D4B|nr:hypothetical protein [Gemella cuniculi]
MIAKLEDINIKTEEAINLLDIYIYTYIETLGKNLYQKSYDDIVKLDKYDYIDFLVEKEKYETLLILVRDLIKSIENIQNELLNSYYNKVVE